MLLTISEKVIFKWENHHVELHFFKVWQFQWSVEQDSDGWGEDTTIEANHSYFHKVNIKSTKESILIISKPLLQVWIYTWKSGWWSREKKVSPEWMPHFAPWVKIMLVGGVICVWLRSCNMTNPEAKLLLSAQSVFQHDPGTRTTYKKTQPTGLLV